MADPTRAMGNRGRRTRGAGQLANRRFRVSGI